MQNIDKLVAEAQHKINVTDNLLELDQIRVDYLGKKGHLTEILKQVSSLPIAERPTVGQLVNQKKRELVQVIEEKIALLNKQALEKKLSREFCDVTLPGTKRVQGSLHPVTRFKHKVIDFFLQLGFEIVHGPEVETEYYNFTALNIPLQHPARAMHDTFYFGDGSLLRTHTSPVQIRYMQAHKPPFRLIAPGKVYRCDSDLTHTPMFHQLEGLLIDKEINFAQLRGTLQDFLTYVFAKNVEVRFRPSYFPFTEPSAEVDMTCTKCKGQGCRICKFSGWLEVGGSGMVHPNVLKAVNIDPNEYQGWAFGMGIDRLAMLYYGIDDLRALFENDLEFLTQF
ncbi:MAG: phenylalanine--tRNA ligase subunit alpha [Legionellales bacterium RIFCSPHIGHO2_12_FULL_37_14]|nr:MAG: phenylalanine--tRNA ligase subunit alpha [Legionellales bacterium RIFCSPHIGHO2_12_FULL_37_14]